MLPIQPICLGTTDEELASIRVGSRVGHGQHTRLFVFVQKIFIVKGGSVNTQFSCSVMIDKISTLNHEIFHDSVKRRFFVACGLLILEKLAGAKLSKVFTCFGTLEK